MKANASMTNGIWKLALDLCGDIDEHYKYVPCEKR
jgi:hypothetical protein